MFDRMQITFVYGTENGSVTSAFAESCRREDFEAVVSSEGESGVKRLYVSILPLRELEVLDLYITCSYRFGEKHRIFANGYQSWTLSREYFPDERLRGITGLAAPIKEKYQMHKYGDYLFHRYPGKRGVFHGYTYGYIREGDQYDLIGSLSELNGYTVIESFCGEDRIIIRKDCKGLYIGEEYEAFKLVWAKGAEDFVFDSYFGLMGIKKPSCRPMAGWTSWYNYYQDISEERILDNLAGILGAEERADIFQVDDGYQCAVGDWLKVDARKFPRGMKFIADEIRKNGLKSGIWLAPFVCEPKSDIYKNKKDWLLRDGKGRPVKAGYNWGGFYALDLGNPDFKDYLRKVFSVVFDQWGYDLVKLDFLYAVCLVPDKHRTRGRIMTEAMRFIRECAGDRLVLGCGVPLGPSFGLVDYCRIGCDISLDWDDKFYMKYFSRERVSTFNAIRDVISRRQLDGRAFLNDPDVYILRGDNNKLSGEQKLTLFTVNYLFGSLLFNSDYTGGYDREKRALYNRAVKREPVKVKKVESYRSGLVEIFYSEGDKNCLALVNLGKRKLTYEGGPALEREITFGKSGDGYCRYGRIILKPCETRLFAI
jgi:alpha-galactosidase